MISKTKSTRVVTPVTAQDRQRLNEIKEKMGSWTAVSEALGFRGASTARKWALEGSMAFKGRNYPERIRALHEKVVGVPVAKKPTVLTTNRTEARLEHVETMMETLLSMLTVPGGAISEEARSLVAAK